MKTIYTFLFFLIAVYNHTVLAQAYETRSYDLSSKTSYASLSEREQSEPAIILLEKKVYEYIYDLKDNLLVYYTVHRHVRINDQASVDNFNKIYLPVNNQADLISLKLRSVSKNGKVREMFKGDMKRITEDGNEYLILAVEGLEKDSELEYYYTIKKPTNFFITEWIQSGVFIRHTNFQLISPSNLIFASKIYNGTATKRDTTISDKIFISYTKDSTPVLDQEEKYSSYNANKLRLEFKLIKNKIAGDKRLFTWADAGNRFYEIMHEQEKSARKDIEKLASTLGLKKLKTPDEQIRKLENFMKTTINNKSDNESPTIANMLKRNYGSENQIASLYVLMFEYLNIPHEFVITTSRFNAFFDSDFDTWNYLDNYLIYFPATGLYLDPVDYSYRYGLISYTYAGNNGLFIKKLSIGEVSNGISSVKKIDTGEFSKCFDNMMVDISFESNLLDAKIKTTREFGGHSDNHIKAAYFYADAENKEDIIEELLKSSFPDMKLKDAKIKNYDLVNDDYNKPLIMESNVTTSSLIESGGNNIIFLIGMVIGPQAELYQDHARQNPITMNYAHSYSRELNITIPEGYEAKGLEKLMMNIVIDDLGMGFTSTYKLEGQILKVTVYEYYKSNEYRASDYENFKKVINAAADFNKIKLILTKG